MAANNSKKKNASKFRLSDIKRLITFNIGTVIFGALFFYMVVSIFLYVTASHVTSYQVTSGPLAKNPTFTALAVRQEETVTADTGGYVSYYARENAKTKKNGVVYSIGDKQSSQSDQELTESSLSTLRSQLETFSKVFDPSNFNNTYSFKSDLDSTILGNSTMTIQNSDNLSVVTIGDATAYMSPNDGVVLYSVDGYEEYDPANVQTEDFDQKSYRRTSLKSSDRLNAGDPVYKIVTSEAWSLIVPMSDSQIVQMDTRTTVKVKFLKDSAVQTADFTILTGEDENYYGKLDFSSGMIRYITDRFVDIELVINTKSGLKIPVSSIVSKDFYVIPMGFATTGGDTTDTGFVREKKDKDGETSTEFVNATIYDQKDNFYYVDSTEFSKDDVILKADSSDRYVIGDTASSQGVFCINKGYALFRRISIIDKNDEYCIVDTGTLYGIDQFDYIVLNASKVKENEILY